MQNRNIIIIDPSMHQYPTLTRLCRDRPLGLQLALKRYVRYDFCTIKRWHIRSWASVFLAQVSRDRLSR